MSRHSGTEHPLYGCTLKLRRANEHLETLDQAVEGFLQRNPHEVRTYLDTETQEYVVWTRVRETPPPEWSTVIGDIVHNLRSALDHLAWQLVKRNGEEPTAGSTGFPAFHEHPFEEGKSKLRSRWKRMTGGMHADDIALVESIQPYARTNPPKADALFILNELWNVDKHRNLLPTLTFQTGANFGIEYMTGYSFSILEQPPAGTCVNGTIISRYALTPLPEAPEREVQMNTDATFHIAIREGEMLEPVKLIPLLRIATTHIADILDSFAPRFNQHSSNPSEVPTSRG